MLRLSVEFCRIESERGGFVKSIIEYLGKRVSLTTVDGRTFEGVVNYYNPPADSDDNMAEFVLITDVRKIAFMENEVSDMKEI